MTINPFLIKTVNTTYGKQLETARRLSRLGQYIKRSGQADAITISREAKRLQLVDKISREIVHNLIGTSSKNPIVQAIRQQLSAEFKNELSFTYSPDGDGLHILKKDEKKKTVRLPADEKEKIISRMWEITKEKVNQTML